MPDLNGSQTLENLKAAFSAEAGANRRCLYFAKIADVEGEPEIAQLYRDIAESQTGHSHGHIDFLKQVGDPRNGLPIGETELNLKASLQDEKNKHQEMYPSMAEQAREEGFAEIASWFETLSKSKASHAARLQRGLDDLE